MNEKELAVWINIIKTPRVDLLLFGSRCRHIMLQTLYVLLVLYEDDRTAFVRTPYTECHI